MHLGMSFSMSPSLRQTQRMEMRQSLSLEQRMEIKSKQTMLLIELAGSLRGERYVPLAKCPKCFRELQPHEILGGFNNDVNDFTTRCTGCGCRFEPRLICFGDTSQIEIPFFCGVQAQDRLQQASHMPPADIAREYPGEYRSAVVHYGTLKAMYKSLGVEYTHPELEGWRAKAQPFLGRMPDTVIANAVNVKVGVITRMRKLAKVKAYCKRDSLKN